MPRSVSDEEIELRKRARRRLVGAIVLVTVAVMILPMVLDQEPRTVTQDIAITIPPKGDAASFAPRAVTPPARPPSAPKPAETPAESKAPAETGKGTAEPPKAEKPAAEPAPPARTAEAVPAAKPEPKPDARPETKTVAKPDAAASAEAFVVQLDAFSNPENARQQQQKLSAAGINSYTDAVKTSKGELTRVRVGPYSTRQQAEQMRDRIRKIGMNAVVVAK